jgi:hypothetical protein
MTAPTKCYQVQLLGSQPLPSPPTWGGRSRFDVLFGAEKQYHPAPDGTTVVSPEKELATWADVWERETGGSSRIGVKVQHRAYRRIVNSAGAVPFILNRLGTHGGWWFDALRELTGEAPDEHVVGEYEKMRQAWLEWGLGNAHRFP